MLQSATEPLCYLHENGFEIFGILHELPHLKQFCEKEGTSIPNFFGNELILVKGFREYTLRKPALRAFSFDGYDFPGEHRPFLSIITPVLERVDYLQSGFSVSDPIGQTINEIERDNQEPQYKDSNDWKKIHLEVRYATTVLKILNHIRKNDSNIPADLFIDLIAVLAEFYAFESFAMIQTYDEGFLKNLPESTLCPGCWEPCGDLKDNRSSQLCKKCRREIKIQKQRERRGTQIVGERCCSCGCGEIIVGRPNKKYKNKTHGRRMQKR